MYSMDSPKWKGLVTEERCKLYFIERGWTISVPLGDNSRYDFILDIGSKLLRVQVKSSRAVDDWGFTFECTTNVSSRTKLKTVKYTESDIDYFCTYFNNCVYLVPVECRYQMTLRYKFPAKDTGLHSIRWAREYEADYVIGILLEDTRYTIRDVEKECRQYLQCQSETNLNRSFHWITDGTITKRIPYGSALPEGFRFGRCI